MRTRAAVTVPAERVEVGDALLTADGYRVVTYAEPVQLCWFNAELRLRPRSDRRWRPNFIHFTLETRGDEYDGPRIVRALAEAVTVVPG